MLLTLATSASEANTHNSDDFFAYFKFIVPLIAAAATFIWANRRDALDLKELEVLSTARTSLTSEPSTSGKDALAELDKRILQILRKPSDYNKKAQKWYVKGLIASIVGFALSSIFSVVVSSTVAIIIWFVLAVIFGISISVFLRFHQKESAKKSRAQIDELEMSELAQEGTQATKEPQG